MTGRPARQPGTKHGKVGTQRKLRAAWLGICMREATWDSAEKTGFSQNGLSVDLNEGGVKCSRSCSLHRPRNEIRCVRGNSLVSPSCLDARRCLVAPSVGKSDSALFMESIFFCKLGTCILARGLGGRIGQVGRSQSGPHVNGRKPPGGSRRGWAETFHFQVAGLARQGRCPASITAAVLPDVLLPRALSTYPCYREL